MDKNQKYEFVKKCHDYLEEKRVYDLFQNLTRQLLIHRPESPIDFLIERIGKREPVRVFIVGPPGSMAKTLSKRISKDLGFNIISVGEIIRKEATKNNDIAAQILEAKKDYRFVSDDIITYIVKNYILKNENEFQNWILEGFPRTKNQALSLQRIGIIPDKFILLNVSRETSIERIKKVMIDEGTTLIGSDLEDAAQTSMDEYDLHIKGVRESYKQFLYETEIIDGSGPSIPSSNASSFVNLNVNVMSQEEIEQDLLKMIKTKLHEPMRPPRIIILGPPGSGRSSQAKKIAKRYGIVHVSAMELLNEEINRKTERGNQIAESISKGELVSGLITISLVENRLKQSDCYVNGWVMDGFPKTIEQVSLLRQMNIVPTKVVILECRQDVCIERLSQKRLDPITGYFYNIADQPPEDDEVNERLVEIEGNDEETIKKRWYVWDEFVGKIEEIYSD